MTTYKIDYRSGVQSEREAETARQALRLEGIDATGDDFLAEQTWSGGDWDAVVYAAEDEEGPEWNRKYFVLSAPSGAVPSKGD